MEIVGSPITTSPQWAQLEKLAKTDGQFHLRDLFQTDPDRATRLVFTAAGITVDLSRQRVTDNVLQQLQLLLADRKLLQARSAMFSGEKINTSEKRAVLHTALRLPKNKVLELDGVDVVPAIHDVLTKMSNLATQIRSGSWVGATGKPIKYVVNIGIGGSDLGPVMAHEALRPYTIPTIEFFFVSNVDGADLTEVFKKIDLEQTLFIVASKTFSTQETMLNATSARNELFKVIGSDSPEVTAKHFVAVSTNSERVANFGINLDNMFGFWDWVGGRYSMDSAIGLSTMIAIGPENFQELLAGFHTMDEHFKSAAPSENLPILMGLIGLWNRSLLGISSVAVLPYDQYLKRFPAYLQQLTMESNGKSVTRTGKPVEVETGALYWGEPGTNGQHSFYQLLHQGSSVVATEILFPAKSHAVLPEHHDVLVSNALSQASVFAFGKSAQQLTDSGVSPELIPHKVMPGNRPTTLITFEKLTPRILGSLVALYEHIVFVQGILWGINSFDQWGVELGKEVANSIAPALSSLPEVSGKVDLSKFDPATQRAIVEYRRLK